MMENNLQRMFAYQEIMAQRGKESICHSAILRCEHGSERCVLNLPKSHGKYVGTHAQIDIKKRILRLLQKAGGPLPGGAV